jgi:hypothetical protein
MSAPDQALLIGIWVVLNLVLSLLPLIFCTLFKFFFDLPVTWIQVLKEGELFVFSTTLSANAISKLILPSPSDPNPAGIISLIYPQLSPSKVCTLIGLGIILLFSVAIFSALSLIKFNNSNQAQAPVKSGNYAIGALSCATTSSLLSYAAFAQGGMK